MKSPRTTVAILACLLPACSSSSSSPAPDAGAAADGSHPTTDSGPGRQDTGSNQKDATSPGSDATPPGSDATSPGIDGGGADAASDAPKVEPFDATGFTSADGGNALLTEPTPEVWTYIPIEGAKCRDGSSTGIAVNLNPASQKLMIFLEGGGACFNSITCSDNPSSFGPSDMPTFFPSAADGGAPIAGHGIMDRSSANPVGEWNFVYIPYCTGDIHAGNNPAGVVPDMAGTQAFVGYNNVDLDLQRIVPTFSSATQVLLTGASGGGFGAAANYVHVQRAFGTVPVNLIDDSGPYMEDPYLAACLQNDVRTVWGLDSTVGADCAGGCNDPSRFFLDFAKTIVTKYPERQFGLMDSMDDGTISVFFGFGEDDCTVTFSQETAATFTAGLDDIRTYLAPNTNAGTFYFPGSDHTSLESPDFYTRTAGTTPLTTWVASLIGGSTSNVGP